MKITILIFLFYIINVNSFILKNNRISLKLNNVPNLIINSEKTISTKTKSFSKIIRSHNIIPTTLLSFTGGWIMNPSLNKFINSNIFISTFITILIMSSSMIFNDLFDMEIDKINNPSRPLITGEITKKEAITYTSIMIILSEILSLKYLSNNLQKILYIVIFKIIIYTPVLKKIPFIKNISCALLIAFCPYFSGMASSNNLLHNSLKLEYNKLLLHLLCGSIFLGSFYTELIMDIADYDGDKNNKINTIPVIFGKDLSWYFSHLVLKFTIIIITIALYCITNLNMSLGFFLMSTFILLTNSQDIKKYDYSKNIIDFSSKQTNRLMFLILTILCIAAKL